MKIVGVVVATSLGLFTLGAARSPGVALTATRTVNAPTRSVYQVDGRSVSMPCHGSGPIPVIFLAGGSDPASTWNAVVDALGPAVLACGFDRPGVAPSEPSPTPLTPKALARILEETLKQAHIGHRFVLVAHSLGGPVAVLFGAAYGKQVAGAVLLDPTVPEFMTLDPSGFMALGFDPIESASQTAGVKRSPNVPLRVLSHDPATFVYPGGFTQAMQDRWETGQAAYAHLSRRGTNSDVPGSGHYIYRDKQAVVVDTINHILNMLKAR